MKTLTRTIALITILNLTVTGPAFAQAVSAPPEPASAPTAPTPPSLPNIEAVEIAAKETDERAKGVQKLMETLHLNLGLSPHSNAGTVLVIPTSEMKAEDLATITEDMTVMSRIIDSQLGNRESRRFLFSGDFLGQSSRSAETMYLQGYGSLFLRKVDFPLSPTQQVQEEEKKTQKEDVDPVWEQIRRDMYEPQEERGRREERPEEKYDAEKVENLKANLIKALKHAANIRNLKPDESVILTVTGSGDSSKAKTVVSRVIVQRRDRGTERQDRRSTGIVTPYLQNESGLSSTATIIIRAKRVDIDAFAKGELDLEKFRQRVQIFTQ
ncbi:MAG: hypothetical protein A2167_05670 [Planctomycetes bacterium RBG_13_46_10]|nr:MAG: hypothetical protein A2167_05670 [Planctomycetes bacterium RBG_13_46_10]